MFTYPVTSAVRSSLLDGLVVWYDLDETSGTRYDSHDNAYHLTPAGTTSYAAGVKGNAFAISSGGYLTRADPPLLDFGDNDFTIAFWYYPIGAGVYAILQKSTNGIDGFYFFSNGTTIGAYLVGGAATSRVMTASAWNHILWQYNATSNQASLRVNLGTASTATQAGGAPNTSAAFRIGANAAGGSSANGRYDIVSIWNRLLTTDEKNEHFNGGAGMSYPG